MKFKTSLCFVLAAFLLLAGCSSAGQAFDPSVEITVVSREDGSGTRSAFVELFSLQVQDANGDTIDGTTLEAVVVNTTAVVMNTVSSNLYAIGYISFGSMNDSVKALSINGAAPTVANVQNGSYPVARPFLIATKGEVSEAAGDFIDFILSERGQAVVEANGYIPLEDAAPYLPGRAEGKVVVSGSSSVAPVMEKLAEAYATANPGATVEIQQSDSSTGLSAVAEGICDIGMTSRALQESEIEKGLVATKIAMDGIAVIVNNDNPVDDLSRDQVRSIFLGMTTTWESVV